MGKVADILSAKGSEVYSTPPEATVYDAVKSMVEHNVGSLLVTSGSDVEGIITERDYLRDITLQGRSSKSTTVKEVMTSKLVCVDPATSTEECMAVMSEKRIRHLPVIEGGALVGVISIGDVVRQLSSDREAHIKYLTDYIADKYPG